MLKIEKRKKRKNKGIDKLPFDCLSNVVEYYERKEEFLSLNLTVRGLYDYVNRIIPQCTMHIEFKKMKLSALPPATNPRKYVTSLFFSDRKDEFDELDCLIPLPNEKINSEKPKNLRALFMYLPKAFPNLQKLNLDLRRKYRPIAKKFPNDVFIPSSPFLKILKITISQTDIRISERMSLENGYLQNLEELTLVSALSLYNPRFERGINADLFDQFSFAIYSHCLPKLRKLELCGWEMSGCCVPKIAKSNVKNLVLENVTICNRRGYKKVKVFGNYANISNIIGESSNVESLTIHSPFTGKNNIQKLFKNLKKLTINLSPKHKFSSKDLLCYRDHIDGVVGVKMNFEMKDLLNLEEIKYLDTYYSRDYFNEEKMKLEIFNLPKLKKVEMRSISPNITEITFMNTPFVEYLDLDLSTDNNTIISLPITSKMKKIKLNNIHINELSTKILQDYKKLQELEINGVCDEENETKEDKQKIILEDMSELKSVKIWKKNELSTVRNCEKMEKMDFFFAQKPIILENLPMLKTKIRRT